MSELVSITELEAKMDGYYDQNILPMGLAMEALRLRGNDELKSFTSKSDYRDRIQQAYFVARIVFPGVDAFMANQTGVFKEHTEIVRAVELSHAADEFSDHFEAHILQRPELIKQIKKLEVFEYDYAEFDRKYKDGEMSESTRKMLLTKQRKKEMLAVDEAFDGIVHIMTGGSGKEHKFTDKGEEASTTIVSDDFGLMLENIPGENEKDKKEREFYAKLDFIKMITVGLMNTSYMYHVEGVAHQIEAMYPHLKGLNRDELQEMAYRDFDKLRWRAVADYKFLRKMHRITDPMYRDTSTRYHRLLHEGLPDMHPFREEWNFPLSLEACEGSAVLNFFLCQSKEKINPMVSSAASKLLGFMVHFANYEEEWKSKEIVQIDNLGRRELLFTMQECTEFLISCMEVLDNEATDALDKGKSAATVHLVCKAFLDAVEVFSDPNSPHTFANFPMPIQSMQAIDNVDYKPVPSKKKNLQRQNGLTPLSPEERIKRWKENLVTIVRRAEKLRDKTQESLLKVA